MKKLITLLENLTNKKVILEDSVFKSRKLDERLLPLKQEFDKNINNIKNSTLTYSGNIYEKELIILEKFYKNYTIDVYGCVDLNNLKLKTIPIKFGYVMENFNISHNELEDLNNCPNEVGQRFDCRYNYLKGLEGCPTIAQSFWCDKNSVNFGGGYVRNLCNSKYYDVDDVWL